MKKWELMERAEKAAMWRAPRISKGSKRIIEEK